MIHRVLLVGVLATLWIPPLPGGEPAVEKMAGVLDIVPTDAVAAVAIRNVAELIKRGDTFIEKAEFKVPFRLSEGYRFVLAYLGVQGEDPEGSAALMLPWIEGDKPGDFIHLVLAVPIADFDLMAEKFKLDAAELRTGKVLKRPDKPDFGEGWYVAVRDRHVFLGMSEKHVAAAAKAKSLRETLPADDTAAFAAHDIFFYAHAAHTRALLGPEDEHWKTELAKLPGEEAAALRQLLAAAGDLQYAAAGIRLDDGLGTTVALAFEGEKSRDALTRLQADGRAKTSLAGLPEKGLIAAHSARGRGENTAAVARGLLHYALLNFQFDKQQLVSAGHRANVVGVFGDVWQQLEGSRAGLYENDDDERDGQFSLVAVLDTADAPKFVTDMTSLARFINAAGFSLDDAAESIDTKTIGELIVQLGDDGYAARQAANTRLGLIGAAALPQLKKAAQADDAEVRFRAKLLIDQINESLTEEKADLLKRDLLTRLQPQFIFFPKAEQRNKRPIDIVQLRLRADEVGQADQLRRMLGPQWSKLRLATVGNQVIVLLGSNTALLDQTIADVSGGKDSSLVERFRSRLPPDGTAEFHLSLTRTQQLLASELKPAAAAPLTSFGVQILPQHVRMDLFAPYEEAKIVVKKMGW